MTHTAPRYRLFWIESWETALGKIEWFVRAAPDVPWWRRWFTESGQPKQFGPFATEQDARRKMQELVTYPTPRLRNRYDYKGERERGW